MRQKQGVLQKEQLLQKISSSLASLTLEELQQIEHVMESLNKTKVEKLHYLGHFLGIEWQPEGSSRMHLGLHNSNTYGAAQGGALYAFADITIGYRIMCDLAESEKVVTLEMKMNYVKPGQGKVLTAKPNILHWGRQTVVGDCSIVDESGDLVAHALGTFFVVRER